MAIADSLKAVIQTQKESMKQLEHEVEALSTSDLFKENDQLKQELERLELEYIQSKQKLKELLDENKSLKNALYEQIYNEKVSILNMVANKTELYFESTYKGEINQLASFELAVRSRIEKMIEQLKKSRVDESDEIYQRLDELSLLLNEKIAKVLRKKEETVAFTKEEKEELQRLKNEKLTDEQIKAAAKKNNIEAFIGKNLINKLGIFLIIIGVIAASQYTYFKLSDFLKGIMMFSFGAAMLVSGEIVNRKKASIFSLGITAGGVAVLFVATSVSYFQLEILSMYPALAVCVLITASTFVLSQRYDSQTIAAFALIGGYLPIFSISDSITMLYGSMVYFTFLNLFALLVSFRKKWMVSAYIGLFLNLVAAMYIVSGLMYRIRDLPFGVSHAVLLVYVLAAFLIYTAIPIISTYKANLQFKKSDIVLLGINTFVSSVILYYVFYQLRLTDYNGLLAIMFAVVYLLLGRFLDTKFQKEKNARALFYITGLAFVVLIIPFQFGKQWLTLGWLAEGVGLTVYGIIKNQKSFRRYGFIINALCVFSFLVFDLLGRIDGLFAYKYFALTAGSVIILGSYIYKNMQFGLFQKFYKYATMVNLWFYALYLSFKINDMMVKVFPSNFYWNGYLVHAMAITFTFFIAFLALRIKTLSDLGTKLIALYLYMAGIIWLLYANVSYSPVSFAQAVPMGAKVMGTIVLIIMNFLSLLAMWDLLKTLVVHKKLEVEWYPIGVSAYFVLLLTQNLIAQYQLSFSSMIISILYVLTALSWIVFGFVKRYSFIRRFGLGLAVFSVGKLFMVDLSYLTQGYKIVSYFSLGISLVGISFVYQYFNKRLEIKGRVVDE